MKALQCFFMEFYDLRVHAATADAEAIATVKVDTGGVVPWCIHLPNNSRICHARR